MGNRSAPVALVIATMTASLLLVVSVASAVAPIDEPFIDVDGNVHEAAIDAIAVAGISRGCNPPLNTRYCPDRTVTRGQMAAFVRRALGLPASTLDHFFDDDGSVFEDDINAIAEAGITRGCNPPSNTRFCPSQTLTRAEMATFLYRALR